MTQRFRDDIIHRLIHCEIEGLLKYQNYFSFRIFELNRDRWNGTVRVRCHKYCRRPESHDCESYVINYTV